MISIGIVALCTCACRSPRIWNGMLTAQTLRFVLLLQIITRYQILGDMQSLILSFDRLINIFCGSTVQILVCVAIGLDSIVHNNILLLLIVCSAL